MFLSACLGTIRATGDKFKKGNPPHATVNRRHGPARDTTKGAIHKISQPDVVVVQCICTTTNRLPAHPQQPLV